jgi:hypothetical protein
MLKKYQDWIDKNVKKALGNCAQETLKMQKEFPELIRVRGFYTCHVWGRREHWWLVDKDGAIIDPTVSQFPSGALGEYTLWREGAEEPTGKCIECGEYTFKNNHFCGKSCADKYKKYMNRGS